MKNKKLWTACMAGVLSAAMLMTSVSAWGAEFSDGAAAKAVGEEMEIEEFTAPEAKAAETAINATVFPDAAFRKYVSDVIDTDKSGTLSAEEKKAVKEINVNGLGIKSLTGIGNFPYITGLYAANNELTSINLSKSTKLTRLNVDSNKLKTLDLSKITAYVETLKYSNNQLTKVTMPARKYLKNIDYINASHNKFTTQTAAGLNISAGDELDDLSEIDVSYNSIASFSCSGFKGKIDLSNNKLTTLKEGALGFQATGLYLEGKNNTLSKTPSINFASIWNTVPQEFSCNADVKSKVTMVSPSLKAVPDWDKVTLTVGASSDDASYKLYRKEGSGAYKLIKSWAAGELDNPEFGENIYVDKQVTPGKSYTYKLNVAVNVQNRDKKVESWAKSTAKTVSTYPGVPSITLKTTKKGYVTTSWKAVPGADGYDVYYGASSKAASAVVKGTNKLYVHKNKLTSGKYYYFRVRAYKIVNGKHVNTGFSTVKKIKVK